MFFYDFNNLDNFINTTISKKILDEKNHVNDLINLYNNKKENLLNITNNMISATNILKDNNLENFQKIILSLKDCFETIESILEYYKTSLDYLNSISAFCENGIENNFNEIKANLVEYNKQNEKIENKIFLYEKETPSILNLAIELTLSISNNSEIITNYCDLNTKIDYITKITGDNDTLVVSEKDQKAYLPYKYIEIENLYKNSSNKFNSLEDVVKKLYVLPLTRFKNSSFSRFREAFNLIKNKENGSIVKALDLGLELMFKYNLNPIIIAACRNLNELDIYLDCLDENELYDFDCFTVKFEVNPKI